MGVVAILSLLRDLLPSEVADRFGRLAGILREGAHTDDTAGARVDEWKRLWSIYLAQYPLGTLVPPSYALRSAVEMKFAP